MQASKTLGDGVVPIFAIIAEGGDGPVSVTEDSATLYCFLQKAVQATTTPGELVTMNETYPTNARRIIITGSHYT